MLAAALGFGLYIAKERRERNHKNDGSNSAGSTDNLANEAQARIVNGMRNHSGSIVLAIVVAVGIVALWSEINAVLDLVGIGWTTLFLLVVVVVVFAAARHMKKEGKTAAAGVLALAAVLMSLGLTVKVLNGESAAASDGSGVASLFDSESNDDSEWDIVSHMPGTVFVFRPGHSVAFETSFIQAAYECSTSSLQDDIEVTEVGRYVVLTPSDEMFLGSKTGNVTAFVVPPVYANQYREPDVYQRQLEAQNNFLTEKRQEFGCSGY